MIGFDVSKDWVIRIPAGIETVKSAAEDLSHYIGLLQGQARVQQKPPALRDTAERTADGSGAVIRLLIRPESGEGKWEKDRGTNGEKNREQNGFSWRLRKEGKEGKEELEIIGESDRGLCNGIYGFLAALGITWTEPEQEALPPRNVANPREFGLREGYAYHPSSPDTIRRRLLFGREGPAKKWQSLIIWAARNQIDTLVFSIRSTIPDKEANEGNFFSKSFQKTFKKFAGSPQELLALAERYAMTIELGGWDLSLFVPRRHYLFNREIFRMDEGKRDKAHNFCPTAPDTIRLLQSESAKVFRSHPDISVYHLWPDLGHEKAWCSCPTCRAFTVEEQNRIAVNAVADTLAQINPQGRISYYENPPRKGDIEVRANLFRINCLPGETGAEAGGWFISDAPTIQPVPSNEG